MILLRLEGGNEQWIQTSLLLKIIRQFVCILYQLTAVEAKISQLSCVSWKGEMEIFQINILILESVYWK